MEGTYPAISQFRSPLIADIDEPPYVLEQPLIYDSVILKGTVTVPAGFLTDLASIPRWVWWAIPKEGKYNAPAVIHDWLYLHGEFSCAPLTQATADRVLLEAMRARNVNEAARDAIYAGVRVGGFRTWNKYRRKGADVSERSL